MIYSENILLCIAIPIIILLPFLQDDMRHFCEAFVSGMIACLCAAYINSFCTQLFSMSVEEGVRYISPAMEEMMKLVPMLMFTVFLTPSIKEILAFAAAIGAGFATFENCCYLVGSVDTDIRFILIRGLAVGVMHVMCGLLLGIGFSLIKRYPIARVSSLAGTISMTITLHSLYNLLVSEEGLSQTIGFATPIGTAVILFILWKKGKILKA